MSRFVLLLLLTAATAAPAHAGRHSIAASVVTRNGTPVGRAIIKLSPGNVELVTDREGRFLIDYLRDDEGERVRLGKKTDYALDVFKVGFHAQQATFYYKKGEVVLPDIVLVEETIEVEDAPENIDPASEATTHAAGANYEGQ